MKLAERFGQDPRVVATWEPDWLMVCQTAMAAENGAQAELERRANRRGGPKARKG